MSYPNAIEVCRAELFTKEVELRERYPQAIVDKVLRVREMYNWFIANPDGTDREFVAEVCQRHGIHRTTAYSDLAVVKSLRVSRNLVGINFRHPNVMPNFAVWKTITYRHWHRWCCQPRF